jgi:hypothetical protein
MPGDKYETQVRPAQGTSAVDLIDKPARGLTMPEDPWEHRSEGMRCRTCMWFVCKANPGMGNLIVGRCRRHAPTMSGYPAVFPMDWCGDHKLDETKV